MKLFIFDFDNTIASEHTHNLIMTTIQSAEKSESNAIKNDPQLQWNIVKNVKPIGAEWLPIAAAEQWKTLFEKIAAEGNLLAIASRSAFPHIIKRYLKETIGLTDGLLNKVDIDSTPETKEEKENDSAKNLQIARIKERHPEATEITLIDDDLRNTEKAREAKHKVIEATSNGFHLILVEQILRSKKKPLYESAQTTRSGLSADAYFAKEFPGNIDLTKLTNCYILTGDNELYTADSKGQIAQVDTEESKIKALLAILTDKHQDLSNGKDINLISTLITQDFMTALNRLFVPDYQPEATMRFFVKIDKLDIDDNKLSGPSNLKK